MKEAEDAMKSFLRNIASLPYTTASPGEILESAKRFASELECPQNPYIQELIQMGNESSHSAQ